MVSLTSYNARLVDGIARFLRDAELGSWDEFGALDYTSEDDWQIYLGPDMPTSPDRVIVVTPGIVSFTRADLTTNVQIRLRGTAGETLLEVQEHAQRIHDVFYPNGFPLAHAQLGEIRVGAVLPGDMLPMSVDGNRRHGTVQNFRYRGRRPRAE